MVHIVILLPFQAHIYKVLDQKNLVIDQLVHEIDGVGTLDVLQVLELKLLDELGVVGVGNLVGTEEFLELFKVVLT